MFDTIVLIRGKFSESPTRSVDNRLTSDIKVAIICSA